MTKEGQQHNVDIEDQVSLKEIISNMRVWWQYFLSKWLILLTVGILGGALGYYYAFTRKPIYTATTTFVLEDEKSGGGLGNLAGLASAAGLDMGGGGGIFQGDNIFGLYKSRAMLEQTLLTVIEVNGKKQTLVENYIDMNKLREQWAKKPALANLRFPIDTLLKGQFLKADRLRDSILGVIVQDISKNYLSVGKPDKKLSLIQVDVKAEDEFFAKAFNEELVKKVNEFYINTKTKKTLQNVRILEYKRDSVRRVMNGAIYSAAAVGDATPNLNPTRQVQRVAPIQRAQFSAETSKAILGTLEQNLELSKMALLKETPLIQVIDQPIYPLTTIKYGRLKGLVIGGFIFVILMVGYLSIKKSFKEV